MRTCYSVFATGSYVKNIPGFVLGALSASAPSRNKNAEASGASRLQIFMRLCSVRERVGTAEAVVMHRRNIEAKKASRWEVKNR